MLEDFSVSAGLDDVTNKPRSFVKLGENRVVVLTTIEPRTRGYDRIILGAFLVEKIIKDEYGADKAISYGCIIKSLMLVNLFILIQVLWE